MWMHICIYMYIYACMYINTYVNICIYICMHGGYEYVGTYIYIYICIDVHVRLVRYRLCESLFIGSFAIVIHSFQHTRVEVVFGH